jgi:hypothetical protein
METHLNRTVYLKKKKVFFGEGPTIWTQGLALAMQTLYHLSHDPRLFCFCYFSDRLSCLCQRPASDSDPPTYASQWWNDFTMPCLIRGFVRIQTSDLLGKSISGRGRSIRKRQRFGKQRVDWFLNGHVQCDPLHWKRSRTRRFIK